MLQGLDNFDDNALAWMDQFQKAKPGDPLFERGVVPVLDLVGAFAKLVADDALPAVTWIVGPTALSEHAENHPGDGEDLSHGLISVLAHPAHASVYAKTAFILNYDQGGQFFDHHWAPTPPRSPADGASTVPVSGELTLDEQFGVPPGSPIGLGFRVPMMIVSPWTRGRLVHSEVSDHASVIKLIERRFGVTCPNLSAWRRAVVGDLTSAFDFASPDFSWPAFPDTAPNVNMSKWECENLPDPVLPARQAMPTQEAGVRALRPLPYEFAVVGEAGGDGGGLRLRISSSGAGTGVFQAINFSNPVGVAPRKFTVEGGKEVGWDWALGEGGAYDVGVYGPNGFVRRMKGAAGAEGARVTLEYDPVNDQVCVRERVRERKPLCERERERVRENVCEGE